MNTKKTIRKIVFVGMWLTIGSGMLMLLIAAMGKQKRESCKGYNISINGDGHEELFLQKENISSLLVKIAGNNIKGQPKSVLNLQQMEEALENNTWIEDAKLYFDNHAMLQVSILERKPIARIFTAGGRSFYLDANDYRMPLSEKTIANVPVFTGFPDKKILAKPDSVLLKDIRTTAQYINGHSFWSSQVAQVDIVPDCGPDCLEFEMIPVVGDHIVKLGDGEDIDKKFDRLYTFYKQVLSKTGFDKYKTIDVRFTGQVVGGKEENKTIKSVQTIRQAVTPAAQLKPIEKKTGIKEADKNIAINKPAETKKEQNQVSTNPQPFETSFKEDKKKEETRIPKAVMPKRVNDQ